MSTIYGSWVKKYYYLLFIKRNNYMLLTYRQLTPSVRGFMNQEIIKDVNLRRLYISRSLNGLGVSQWQGLITDAAMIYDDEWLADTLVKNGLILTWYKKSAMAAAVTLASGEFNRYYIRGICLEAIRRGLPVVHVYRAKEVWAPRPDSLRLVGSIVDPTELLADLRNNIGQTTGTGIPGGPNSGISVYY